MAADTVRRLSKQDAESYFLVTQAADQFEKSLIALKRSIPCYGLSSAPSPPPPLRREAQALCAEGADIAKGYWRLFLTQIEIASE
ncbi:hypothetical protein [Nonomuraea sp. B19D2]|uniref:hypothetical protein n=1 Tax=Nonomuraea sp. B19D2 TaxID=3159561 RepID=UPI0032DA436D